MQTLHVRSQSGADRVLHLDIPVEAANAEYDIVVVFHPKTGTKEHTTPEDRCWPAGFIDQTAGSIEDPTFRRHELPAFEKRLEF